MTADQYVELTDLATNAEHVSVRLYSEARQWESRATEGGTHLMAEAARMTARYLREAADAASAYAWDARAELNRVRL